MRSKTMKINNLFIVIGLSFLLSACSEPRAPEDIVAERAQARWDALIAKDFDQAWSYYSPGFRAQNPASSFAGTMQSRPIRWDSAEIRSVECAEAGTCTVVVSVAYTAIGAPGPLADMQNERPLNETWVELEGEWWYSYKE